MMDDPSDYTDEIETLRNERDVLQDAFISRGITIETLRQQVKMLEPQAQKGAEIMADNIALVRERAALKQRVRELENDVSLRDRDLKYWEMVRREIVESYEAERAALKQENERLVNRIALLSCVNGALRSDSEALATLKQQGEPVAWMVSFDAKLGGANVTDKLLIWRKGDASNQVREELIRKIEPLYAAAPQTCFSAADMADQGAKAFKEGVASVTT